VSNSLALARRQSARLWSAGGALRRKPTPAGLRVAFLPRRLRLPLLCGVAVVPDDVDRLAVPGARGLKALCKTPAVFSGPPGDETTNLRRVADHLCSLSSMSIDEASEYCTKTGKDAKSDAAFMSGVNIGLVHSAVGETKVRLSCRQSA
jgi:hypothetical protein